MTTLAMDGDRARGLLFVGAGLIALVTIGAAARYGAAAFALPFLALAVIALVRRPEVAVGLVLGVAVLAETAPDAVIPTEPLYNAAVGTLSPLDLLFLIAIAAVGIDCARRRQGPRLPGPFTIPLALVAAALLGGLVTGWYGGAVGFQLYGTANSLVYLIVTPILVATVADSQERVLRLLAVAAALLGVKAVVGVVTALSGLGGEVEGQAITYYEATVNWLSVLCLLAITAGWIRGAKLPRPTVLLWLIVLTSLVLSFRRSFWIAAVLGLLIVLLFGLGPLQRRLSVPAVAIVVLGVWACLSVGLGTQLQGPVVDRAESISPTKVRASKDDRYRFDERANVIAELREHPVTGLGIGVPWVARHPLPIENDLGRQYTHVAVLWFWLKLGLLGAIAYVALMATAVVAAYRVFREHPHPWLSAFGLGAFGGLLGLIAAETTATFTGVDGRFCLTFGALLGVLAVLRHQARHAVTGDGGRGPSGSRARPRAS